MKMALSLKSGNVCDVFLLMAVQWFIFTYAEVTHFKYRDYILHTRY